MTIAREHEWILVGCGLVAHADEIIDIGEWDGILRLLEEVFADDSFGADTWRTLLSDQAALEERFEALEPPPAETRREILRRCWSMALVDGGDTEIEVTVYERIARALGVDEEEATAWREAWSEAALDQARLVAGLAACLANLDGTIDFREAIHFDNLLERLPLPIGQRLDLAQLLHKPPRQEPLERALRALSEDERLQVLHQLMPLVRASERGGAEVDALLAIATRAGVEREHVVALLKVAP
jgi:uncharacterized tellurite resistance protein B-like protein